MKLDIKSIEELVKEDTKLVEVELMLTPSELQKYAKFCKDNDVKFNDWIRSLAFKELS
jgi:hypothetical protein